MIVIDRERLRRAIADRGVSPRAVSRAIGGNDTLVRDILSGRTRSPRSDSLARIADYLNLPMGEFISGVDGPEEQQVERITTLPMLGPVRAGAWLALDDYSQEEPEQLPAAYDRRYPNARQWLRLVEGDSMNARNIYPGDLAHIVDLISSGVNLNTGMIVEVTRTRSDGLREITLKEVEFTDEGGMLLWPRSTNQRWNQPLSFDEGTTGDVEIEVTGLLLSKITRF